jgi:type II secretory pathway predicted ATPase ExeA
MSLGEVPGFKKVTMFQQIQDAITNLYHEQKITPVIILDEIQLVSSSILEDLRLLFNFKMDSENPFILILSGQSQIRNKLQLSVNTPLRQRIAIRYVMQGLSKEETGSYVEKRLRSAGLTENILKPEAIEVIYSISKGAPRIVNTLATASLMYACSKKQTFIDEESVYQGQRDFDM